MAKLAIMCADGCEEIEALTQVDLLRRAGIAVDMISITSDKTVTGSHGIAFSADRSADEFDAGGYDGIILPGGMPGTDHLKESRLVTDTVKQYFAEGKLVSAICAAPTVLGACGVLKGKKAVCFPSLEDGLTGADVSYENAVTDGNVITGRGMGTAIDFGLAIIAYINGQDAADAMAEKIVYRFS